MKKILYLSLFLTVNFSFGQNIFELFKVQNMLDDAVKYSDNYLSPATNAAIYQSSTSWITTAKPKKLWDVTFELHGNFFVVPKKDRSFVYKNSDYSFFQLQNTSEAELPTAIGSNQQYDISGTIFGNEIKLRTPEGVNREVISYPYLHVALGLPFGLELVTRTSTITKLGEGNYFIYGYGLKCNLSRYFKKLMDSKINIALMPVYSREDLSVNFLNIPSNVGNFGINKVSSKVDTYHCNLAISKEFKNFEIIAVGIANYSNFQYELSNSGITDVSALPFAELLNPYVDKLESPKVNFLGEITANYSYNKFSVITSLALGKFVNGNIGFAYRVN